jgi:hypothetical protein
LRTTNETILHCQEWAFEKVTLAHQLLVPNATTFHLYQVQVLVNPNKNKFEGTFYHDLTTNEVIATPYVSRYVRFGENSV